MTAFDYARSKASADRLLARFGQTGAVRRTPQTGTGYNPTDGTPVNHTAVFAVIDYSSRDIDGTRVLATDKLIIMGVGTLTITPAITDLLVEANGGVYKIVNVSPINPAGTVVAYEIQARR